MTSAGTGPRPDGSAEAPSALAPLLPAVRYLQKVLTIAEMEARKLRHDPTELLTRAIQPALWLLIFGTVLNQLKVIDTGDVPYIDFLTPGVLAQSVLFISIFYGIAIVWERDLGMAQKFLVSPIPRTALVAGKGLASGIRSLSQGLFIYVLAFILGVSLVLDPLSLFLVVVALLLGAALFATLSLIIACLVKSRERFMGIGQLITMPLFFASNAIYPIDLMPRWLQVIAVINPLTYLVDALRGLMIVDGVSEFGIGTDLGVLAVWTFVLMMIASRLYGRIGQ